MQPRFAKFSDLSEWLLARIQTERHHLVAIDGTLGAGKSTLSRRLGASLDCPVVECDWFLTRPDQFYPQKLNLEMLQTLARSILSTKRALVLEGVALLDIAGAIDLPINTHVYVRKNWPAGTYSSADLFDDQLSENELLGPENELARAIDIPDHAPILYREMIIYHKRSRPHVAASAIYENTFKGVSDAA